MRSSHAIVCFIVLAATALAGCGNDTGSAGAATGAGETKYGLTESQRIDVFHEVEMAIVRNERQGREEFPEGGPECLEYVACLDDDSKAEIAAKYSLTPPQLDELIREGEQSGWSQW
jgi:predicted small secreted protein